MPVELTILVKTGSQAWNIVLMPSPVQGQIGGANWRDCFNGSFLSTSTSVVMLVESLTFNHLIVHKSSVMVFNLATNHGYVEKLEISYGGWE